MAKIRKKSDIGKGLRDTKLHSPRKGLISAHKECPAALHICDVSSHAILNLRHRRNDGYHILLGAGVDNLIGHNSRVVSHKAHIPFCEVLRGRSIAVEHLAYGGEAVAAAVGIKQYEHSAISVSHSRKLLEVGVAAGAHLALIAHPRAADVARVVIAKTPTHHPPPFRCGASASDLSTQRAEHHLCARRSR